MDKPGLASYGRLFRLFKFRSMTADDEGPEVTLGNRDRRITKVGRVLRRYKLDELPQPLECNDWRHEHCRAETRSTEIH